MACSHVKILFVAAKHFTLQAAKFERREKKDDRVHDGSQPIEGAVLITASSPTAVQNKMNKRNLAGFFSIVTTSHLEAMAAQQF